MHERSVLNIYWSSELLQAATDPAAPEVQRKRVSQETRKHWAILAHSTLFRGTCSPELKWTRHKESCRDWIANVRCCTKHHLIKFFLDLKEALKVKGKGQRYSIPLWDALHLLLLRGIVRGFWMRICPLHPAVAISLPDKPGTNSLIPVGSRLALNRNPNHEHGIMYAKHPTPPMLTHHMPHRNYTN